MLHETNCSADSLAANRVRDTEYARLSNLRMGLDQHIYFGRLHFEPGTIDFILDPTGQPNSAEFIDDAAISGAKPAIGHNVCGKVGTIEITGRQTWRLYDDLPLASPLECAAVIDDG